MPIYLYGPSNPDQGGECCKFETLQSLSELPTSVCPQCGQPVMRLFSGFGVTKKAEAGSSLKQGQRRPQNVNQNLSPIPSSQSDSQAGRAASLAMKHFCAPGCRH